MNTKYRHFDTLNAIADNWLPSLGTTALKVLFVFLRHADKSGEAYPPVRLVASKAGCSPRNAERGIAQLRRMGFLEKVGDGGGRGHATHYVVRIPQTPAQGVVVPLSQTPAHSVGDKHVETPAQDDGVLKINPGATRQKPRRWASLNPGAGRRTNNTEQLNEQHNSKNTKTGGVSGSGSVPITNPKFQAFWRCWPKHGRKVDESGCAKIWERKNLDAESAAIMAALASAKVSRGWMKDGGEYVPMPATWLNQRRWEAPTGEPVQETQSADALLGPRRVPTPEEMELYNRPVPEELPA